MINYYFVLLSYVNAFISRKYTFFLMNVQKYGMRGTEDIGYDPSVLTVHPLPQNN